jgi:hypothetical protein
VKAKKVAPVERKYRRQHEWQLRQASKGLCRKCTKKLSRRSRMLCDAHLIAERVRMRVRIGYAPKVAAREGKFKAGRKGAGNTDLRIKSVRKKQIKRG